MVQQPCTAICVGGCTVVADPLRRKNKRRHSRKSQHTAFQTQTCFLLATDACVDRSVTTFALKSRSTLRASPSAHIFEQRIDSSTRLSVKTIAGRTMMMLVLRKVEKVVQSPRRTAFETA